MDILSGINVSGNSKFYGDFFVSGSNNVRIEGSCFSSWFQLGSFKGSRIPLAVESCVDIPSGCSSFYVPGTFDFPPYDFIDAFAIQSCGIVFKSVKVDSKMVCGDTSPIITVAPNDNNWSLMIHVLHY